MIAAVSTGPILEKTKPFVSQTASTSLFASAALFESAPWLNEALSRVHELEQAGQDYPGVGDLRVPAATGTATRILLSNIDLPVLPKTNFSVASGGAIVLSFNTAQREAEFTIFPSGAVVLNLLQGGELTNDAELLPSDQRQVKNAVLWALGRL